MNALLDKNINQSQTRLLYNPQLQSDETVEKLFVVRIKQFDLLLNKILQEKENSIPQHHLIIGQRGMGKTTLLKRIEAELHKEQYRQQFIPLLYREEQYNVKDLAEFWLNTLDALADSLQSEKYQTEKIKEIDRTIRELSCKSPETILEEAYEYLMKICCKLHRRPVLLIDNIGLVFSRLDNNNENKTEQWALRKLLSENGAPIVIGGGVTLPDETNVYSMPFYDFFQTQHLYKLNYNEFTELLIHLAAITNSDRSVLTATQRNVSRKKSLLELTGGSPRLTVILFEQIAKGFSSNIYDDLEILADAITPLYKARFEELSTQQQIILDAIALKWDAISLNDLSIATRMKNNQLSPQLKRLIDDGWLETTPAYGAKGNAYFISERFFNIYYIIRNSSRRHKDKIYCLSKFLESLYGEEELDKITDILLKQDFSSSEEIRLRMAFSHIDILEESKRQQLKESISNLLFNDEKLRKEFDCSKEKSLLDEANELFNEKKYEEAFACFDEAIRSDPENACHWGCKGLSLAMLERHEEAIICSEEAIRLDSENAFYWCRKGCALNQLERYEEAVVCFDEATKLDDTYRVAWNNKGFALIQVKRYKEAVFAYEKSRAIDPHNLLSKLQLVYLYRDKLYEMNKAIELFNSIAEEDFNTDKNKKYFSLFYLEKTLFELYKRNEGLAKEFLIQAFEVLEREDTLASVANQNRWTRFGNIVIKLRYGSWLLAVLKEKNYDVVLSPYYTAIEALEIEQRDSKNGKKHAEIYLKNRAIEISNPARIIIDRIKKFG